MSYADIQALASLLPRAERVELTRYLTALETEDELRVLLSQRMRAMDAGRSVSPVPSGKNTSSLKQRGTE